MGGCPLNARNFNFLARVALGSAKEKLKFGFSGGLFALLKPALSEVEVPKQKVKRSLRLFSF